MKKILVNSVMIKILIINIIFIVLSLAEYGKIRYFGHIFGTNFYHDQKRLTFFFFLLRFLTKDILSNRT